MTARIFEDPLDGASYSPGNRFRSSHANPILEALRRIDESFTFQGLGNLQAPAVYAAGADMTPIAVFDDTLLTWAFASATVGGVGIQTSGIALSLIPRTVPSTSASTEPTCAASSGAGKMLFGLTPGSATASKILESTDGNTWTLRTIGSSNTKGVRGLAWDAVHSRFVALVSSDSDGSAEIYTSPDGITWTSRTVPGDVERWAADSPHTQCIAVAPASALFPNGRILAIGHTVDSAYSDDGGVTWTACSTPEDFTKKHVAFAKGVERFVFTNGLGSGYVSADGLVWEAFTTATWNASGHSRVFGFGGAIVLGGTSVGLDGPTTVHAAYDQPVPTSWQRAVWGPSARYNEARSIGSSDHQIVFFAFNTDDTETAVFMSQYV